MEQFSNWPGFFVPMVPDVELAKPETLALTPKP